MSDVDLDDLLTSSEAAIVLGRSYRTVQRMAIAGEIPVERKLPGPNGAYLFRRGDVDAARARLLEQDAQRRGDAQLPGLQEDVA